MADITLIVIGSVPGFVATNPRGQYQKGDIFDVRLTSEMIHPPAPDRKFVHIHITGVPATAIQKAKFLTRLNLDPAFPEHEQVMLGRRRWRGLLDDLPVGLKQQLQNNREITITWTKAKPFIKDHVADRLITDSDFD